MAPAKTPIQRLQKGLQINRLGDLAKLAADPATPIGVLVDCPRKVRLIDDAQHVLQCDSEQSRSRPCQKRQYGKEVVMFDCMMAQYIQQHIECVAARIVGLSRIEPERSFQRQIASASPTGKCREIMGIERDQRVFRIAIGRTKPAIVIAFATTALLLVVLLAARGLTGTDHVDGREPEA